MTVKPEILAAEPQVANPTFISPEKKLFFFQQWINEGELQGHVVVQLALTWSTMKHVYWQGVLRKEQYSDALALAYDMSVDLKKDCLSRKFAFSPSEIKGMMVYKGQVKRPERKLKVG